MSRPHSPDYNRISKAEAIKDCVRLTAHVAALEGRLREIHDQAKAAVDESAILRVFPGSRVTRRITSVIRLSEQWKTAPVVAVAKESEPVDS